MTYAGKYYEVQSIATDDVRSGVVLRRAADHIRDRRFYRQWRTFTINDLVESVAIGAKTDRAGIVTRRMDATIQVNCHGYYELASRSDMDSARPVRVDGIPVRQYSNKSILEVRLPGITDEDRRSITLLLNEIFVSTYPNAHPYIIALTDDQPSQFGALLTDLQGEIDSACIYIVEDSMVDLGLTVSVERNWDRFMEIITDYLTWYTTPPEPEDAKEEERVQPQLDIEIPEVPHPLRKKSWFGRIRDRLSKRRNKGDDAVAEPTVPNEDSNTPDAEAVPTPDEPQAEASDETGVEETEKTDVETDHDQNTDGDSQEDGAPDPANEDPDLEPSQEPAATEEGEDSDGRRDA